MLIISTISTLSNAVILRRDKSIFFSRVAMLILFYFFILEISLYLIYFKYIFHYINVNIAYFYLVIHLVGLIFLLYFYYSKFIKNFFITKVTKYITIYIYNYKNSLQILFNISHNGLLWLLSAPPRSCLFVNVELQNKINFNSFTKHLTLVNIVTALISFIIFFLLKSFVFRHNEFSVFLIILDRCPITIPIDTNFFLGTISVISRFVIKGLVEDTLSELPTLSSLLKYWLFNKPLFSGIYLPVYCMESSAGPSVSQIPQDNQGAVISSGSNQNNQNNQNNQHNQNNYAQVLATNNMPFMLLDGKYIIADNLNRQGKFINPDTQRPYDTAQPYANNLANAMENSVQYRGITTSTLGDQFDSNAHKFFNEYLSYKYPHRKITSRLNSGAVRNELKRLK